MDSNNNMKKVRFPCFKDQDIFGSYGFDEIYSDSYDNDEDSEWPVVMKAM